MRIAQLYMALFISILSCPAGAEEVLWKWDNDGATDVLFVDERCECYYSMSLAEKVQPMPGRHFILSGARSQIITAKREEFIPRPLIPAGTETLLRAHMEYEYQHLQGVVGDDAITMVSDTYDDNGKSLTWILKRTSVTGTSILASTSIVSGKCVVYISSLIDNLTSVERITQLQTATMQSLNLHRPSSQKEAENLLSRYIDDKQ